MARPDDAAAAAQAARSRLEHALLREPEVNAVAADMARHDHLNSYMRLLMIAVTPPKEAS